MALDVGGRVQQLRAASGVHSSGVRPHKPSATFNAEGYLAREPRTPFVPLENERLFHRHQCSVLLRGWMSHKHIADGQSGSPALSTFFGDHFSEEDQKIHVAAVRDWQARNEEQKCVVEALSLSNGLTDCLRRGAAVLNDSFIQALSDYCEWYGGRWKFYHQRFQETAGERWSPRGFCAFL